MISFLLFPHIIWYLLKSHSHPLFLKSVSGHVESEQAERATELGQQTCQRSWWKASGRPFCMSFEQYHWMVNAFHSTCSLMRAAWSDERSTCIVLVMLPAILLGLLVPHDSKYSCLFNLCICKCCCCTLVTASQSQSCADTIRFSPASCTRFELGMEQGLSLLK